MNSDLNIRINPEALDEKAEKILAQVKVIDEALKEIETAKSILNSWESVNKEKYDAKINAALPKMHEMNEVIASYGGVARVTSGAIRDTENIISRAIDQNQDLMA